MCYTVTVGDIDGDGIPDLVTTGYLGDYYLLGMGDGSFKPPVGIPGPANSPLILVDLNNDGKLDIVANSGIGIASYLNISRPAPVSVR